MKRSSLVMCMRSLLVIACLVVFCFPATAQQNSQSTGTVWFYRDTDPSALDPTLFKIVPSFAERLAVLKPDSYFALDLPAGIHRFSWTAAPAKGETLSLAVAGGQQIFVKVQFRGMERVDAGEATRRLQAMEPITSPLAFDPRVSRRVFSGEPALPDVAVSNDAVATAGSAAVLAAEQLETPALSHAPASTASGAPMTNEDVLMLVDAGFSADLIAAKIRSSKTNFDTSPAELVALKKAGVHDSIILLMIGTVPTAEATPSGPATPELTASPSDSSASQTAASAPTSYSAAVPSNPSERPVTPPAPNAALPDSVVRSTSFAQLGSADQIAAASPAPEPAPSPVPVDATPPSPPKLLASMDSKPMHRLSDPPKIIAQPQVVYPEEARRNGVQGIVEIDVVIQRDGSIIGMQLVSSPHPLLSETALQSVSRWQFEWPREFAETNVNLLFRVAVEFAIE